MNGLSNSPVRLLPSLLALLLLAGTGLAQDWGYGYEPERSPPPLRVQREVYMEWQELNGNYDLSWHDLLEAERHAEEYRQREREAAEAAWATRDLFSGYVNPLPAPQTAWQAAGIDPYLSLGIVAAPDPSPAFQPAPASGRLPTGWSPGADSFGGVYGMGLGEPVAPLGGSSEALPEGY